MDPDTDGGICNTFFFKKYLVNNKIVYKCNLFKNKIFLWWVLQILYTSLVLIIERIWDIFWWSWLKVNTLLVSLLKHLFFSLHYFDMLPDFVIFFFCTLINSVLHLKTILRKWMFGLSHAFVFLLMWNKQSGFLFNEKRGDNGVVCI